MSKPGADTRRAGLGARSRLVALGMGWAVVAMVVARAALAQAGGGGPAEQVRALVQAGQIGQAAQVARQWAAEEPGNPEALMACAELGERAGLYSAAEEALRGLLFFEPNVPATLTKLGEVLVERGRYREARKQFEAAIHLVDSFVPAFVGLARLERLTSEVPADVLSAAEVAQSVGPQSAGARAAVAGAHLDDGRTALALELIEQALGIDANYAPAWYDKGVAHARLGEASAARAAWQRYLQLEPATAEAWKLRQALVVVSEELLCDRSFYGCYSPDGKLLAYRARGPGGWGVYVRTREPLGPERLLWATEATLQSLDFSPDSRYLLTRVYEKTTVEEGGQQKEQWTFRLYLLPVEGGGEAKAFYEDRWLGEPAWNMATGEVVVRAYQRQKGYVLLSIDPRTGKDRVLEGTDPRVPYESPRWSLDGKLMLVVRRGDTRPDGSAFYELLTGPGDDVSKLRVIFGSEDYIRTPRFSPDGQAVLFNLSLGEQSQRYPTWAVPTDGSREPCLVDPKADSSQPPEMAPDGKYLLAGRAYALHQLRLSGISIGAGETGAH